MMTCNSCHMGRLKALCASGRLNVTVAVFPAWTTVSFGEVMVRRILCGGLKLSCRGKIVHGGPFGDVAPMVPEQVGGIEGAWGGAQAGPDCGGGWLLICRPMMACSRPG